MIGRVDNIGVLILATIFYLFWGLITSWILWTKALYMFMKIRIWHWQLKPVWNVSCKRNSHITYSHVIHMNHLNALIVWATMAGRLHGKDFLRISWCTFFFICFVFFMLCDYSRAYTHETFTASLIVGYKSA